jgi:septal ring factor EnvC (AmiA/AmiB activator)
MEQQVYTIVITLITVLTSTAAWKFWERKLAIQTKKEMIGHRDDMMYRDDLRERIVKLETLLDESSKEKDKMRENIIILTTSLSRLEVEVDFLRKENEKLRAENQFLRNKT